jgi:YD repeat-containing protein
VGFGTSWWWAGEVKPFKLWESMLSAGARLRFKRLTSPDNARHHGSFDEIPLGLGARVLAREGHLVKVTEPNPEGGLLDTTYTYSDLGQLLTVNMTRGGVTQTRTWAYDADKRERLVSVTHPESGTTLFSYNIPTYD